jgi:hypothetical protein
MEEEISVVFACKSMWQNVAGLQSFMIPAHTLMLTAADVCTVFFQL